MKNIIFLIIIGIGILSAFLGYLISTISSEYNVIELGQNMFNYGLNIGGFIGLIMLLINGTFIKTKYFKISQGIISIIIIGSLLKIMHYSAYANHIIVIGLIGIVISYLLSFLNKPIKKTLDYLKVSWVILSYTISILIFLHKISKEYFDLENYLLWLTIIYFTFTGLKNKTIFKKT